MGRGEKLAPWNDDDDPGGRRHVAMLDAIALINAIGDDSPPLGDMKPHDESRAEEVRP